MSEGGREGGSEGGREGGSGGVHYTKKWLSACAHTTRMMSKQRLCALSVSFSLSLYARACASMLGGCIHVSVCVCVCVCVCVHMLAENGRGETLYYVCVQSGNVAV